MKQRGFTSTSMSYPYNLLESHLWITNRHECRAAKLHAVPWMRTAGIRTTQPNQTRTNACYVQFSVTLCRPILEIWLIEWFVLLCWADDDNDIEVLELPLQCTNPAKAFQVRHHLYHHHTYSHQCITTNITQREDCDLLKRVASLSGSQSVSKMKATDKPPLLKRKSWNPTQLNQSHAYTQLHTQHGKTSGISGLERVPEKATGNWGGTGW
jgi:hypothetical protein